MELKQSSETVNVVVWQCRPNYHDIEMYASLSNLNIKVTFVFDECEDIRDSVNLQNLSQLYEFEYCTFSFFNLGQFLKLIKNSSVNFIVGGMSFKSTAFAHLFTVRNKKVFVSEGRFASISAAHYVKDFFEKIFCNSEIYLAIGSNAQNYFRRLFKDSVSILPFLYFYLDETKQPKKSTPICDRHFSVVFIGDDALRKGIDIFIDLSIAHPEIQFSIIGNGGANFISEIDEIENLHYLGRVPQTGILEEIKKHDCLVLPSRVEPYGCVVQEAIACGLSVICSPFVGARSLKGNYSDQVHVANHNTASAYISILSKLQIAKLTYGISNVSSVFEKFSVSKGQSDLINIIESVTGSEILR